LYPGAARVPLIVTSPVNRIFAAALPARVTVTPEGMFIVVKFMQPEESFWRESMLMVVLEDPGKAPREPLPPLRLEAGMESREVPATKSTVVLPRSGPSIRTLPGEPCPPKEPYRVGLPWGL
jgi:hypothetical protein